MIHRVLALATSVLAACATRSVPANFPTRYACADAELVDDGSFIRVGATVLAEESRDDAGRHFVGTTNGQPVEYVIPPDPHADAVERAATGRAASCIAAGGYTDALARFARGASMRDIQAQLSLADPMEARALVHQAMVQLQRRYFKDQ